MGAERMFQGRCIVFAFQRNFETGKYDQPIAACASCEETNKAYDFLDLVRLCKDCLCTDRLALELIYFLIEQIFFTGVSFSDLPKMLRIYLSALILSFSLPPP